VIVFSDILVVPDALGCEVGFVEGEGPLLRPVRTGKEVQSLRTDDVDEHLQPMFQGVRQLREAIPREIAVIGFAGAPWTVAVYMVEGRGGGESDIALSWCYSAPDSFAQLIEKLVEATVVSLTRQIENGADLVMLFDSWAGLLSESQFRRWVIEPTAEVVKRLRAARLDVPVIGFPRGAGALYEEYVEKTGVDGVNIDSAIPVEWARQHLQRRCLVQGNLDNHLLVAGGAGLEAETRRILEVLGSGPMVFNLGHGILPQTPPENVARVANCVRNWRRSD
jgi:uroporphyrinogen decarboxylase